MPLLFKYILYALILMIVLYIVYVIYRKNKENQFANSASVTITKKEYIPPQNKNTLQSANTNKWNNTDNQHHEQSNAFTTYTQSEFVPEKYVFHLVNEKGDKLKQQVSKDTYDAFKVGDVTTYTRIRE